MNKNISNINDSHYYHGQSLHRLPHDVYEQNYTTKYISHMSPHVSDIFNDTSSKNTAFNITIKPVQATKAYDFNKLYAYILLCCNNDDIYGWSQFLPTDEVKPFDGVISKGIYFVKCYNAKPFRGNGWYCDSFVADALHLNLINCDDVLFQIKASNKLHSRFF